MNNAVFMISEKSCILKDSQNKISLLVDPVVTKGEVKSFLQSKYSDLKILSVNSMIVKGKERRFRGKVGKRQDKKKFIVTVQGGKDLDLAGL